MTDRVVNGWRIYPHPLFSEQYLRLVLDAERVFASDPETYKTKKAAKLLEATRRMALEDIPADPSDPKFRQGGTLGDDYKHWRRGKFLQQYRLFFRYSEKDRIIVLAWVNDDDTKRAYESKNDAYRVFAKMLARDRPPDDWKTLLSEAMSAPPLPGEDI